MNIPTKKLASGFEIPVYGIGLWGVGGSREADYSRDDVEVAAIRAAIDAGVTHIDTAELYGNGHAEELLGKAIKGYDRTKLFIASKVGHDGETTPERIKTAVKASLDRIGTDYIDLYYLHKFPGVGYDLKSCIETLNDLVDQGIVKNIALSNVTPNRFAEAQKFSRHKLVCNQVHYNVKFREAEDKGVLQYCQDNDVMLVAWRPLQKGGLPETELINQLAAKYNKTPSQILLNWLISQNNVVTIAKTTNIEHLNDNLGALGWQMDTKDIEKVRIEYPDQVLVSDAVPLDYPATVQP